MKLKTAIIVPTWNNSEMTLKCFYSLKATMPRNAVLIWVDNGSDEKEVDRVKSYLKYAPTLTCEKILFKENLGFIKATNAGWKMADEMGVDQVVLLNNDTELPKMWLDRLGDAVGQGFHVIGPISSKNSEGWQSVDNIVDKLPLFRSISLVDNWKKMDLELYKKYENIVYPINGMVAFFCTLITREVREKIGFLNEAYGIGFGDDDDYCLTATKAGFKIGLHCGLLIKHHRRSTFKLLKEKTGFDFLKYQDHNIELFKRRANGGKI